MWTGGLRRMDSLQIRMTLGTTTYSANKQSLVPAHFVTALSRITSSHILCSFHVNSARLIFIKEIIEFVMGGVHGIRMARMRIATVHHRLPFVSNVRR